MTERTDYTVTVKAMHLPFTRSCGTDSFARAKQIAQQFADDGYQDVNIIEHVGQRRTIAVFANTWRP